NRLEIAVEEGARYAAIVPYDSTSTTPSSAYLSAVRNVVVYGSPTGGTAAIVGGLTASNVNLTVTFGNGVPATVEVGISGYTVSTPFGNHALSGKPKVTYPYQGIWSPV